MAGAAMPHNAMKGITASRIRPRVASAKPAKPRVPNNKPERRLRRSPNRFTNGPTSAPETTAAKTPTTARDRPTSRRLHADHDAAYNPHIQGNELFPRQESVGTNSSPASLVIVRSQ